MWLWRILYFKFREDFKQQAEVIRYETYLLRFWQNYFYTLIADKLTLGGMHVNTHEPMHTVRRKDQV